MELRLLSFQNPGFLVPKKMGALNVQLVLITQTERNASGILRDNISEEDHYSCWNFNHEKFSTYYFGNRDTLLNDPDLVT